jgi:hypothetical protein
MSAIPTSGGPDLSWLADAPVFVDSLQIGAFYDAVVGPAFKTVQLQVTASQTEQLEKSSCGSLGTGLPALFPWLKGEASVTAQRTRSRGRQEDRALVLVPVETAARQLVQLSLHYLVNQANRICAVAQGSGLPGKDDISASPRMIAFIDVLPGAMFLPQAAELDDGRVITFFERLIEKLRRDVDDHPPDHPGPTSTAEGEAQRDAHWKWYADRWNVDEAVKVIEEAIGAGGRPRWVDYRMTFSTDEVLHLHVDAHGDYDTGVFAYNLLRRGQRYGLRIVGSLKSQPAVNVLAIYEK